MAASAAASFHLPRCSYRGPSDNYYRECGTRLFFSGRRRYKAWKSPLCIILGAPPLNLYFARFFETRSTCEVGKGGRQVYLSCALCADALIFYKLVRFLRALSSVPSDSVEFCWKNMCIDYIEVIYDALYLSSPWFFPSIHLILRYIIITRRLFN
jgi:hypothetical protein